MNLDAALEDWCRVVGAPHVQTGPGAGGPSTIGVDRGVPARVRPGSVEEVQECVRIASRHGVPFHPTSTGRNWGYGTAQPVGDRHVVLDLGRMNRVVEIDEEMGWCVVEPGVTQGSLHADLESHGLALQIDPNGAGPNAGILGNALERGYGLTAYGDHFAQVCGMEIVLADGRLVRTGFWRFENCRTRHLYRYGVGPTVDGLFAQSNLGVVTRVGYWLMKKPKRTQAFFFNVRDENAIEPLVDAVRELLLDGVLHSGVNLLDRERAGLTMGNGSNSDLGAWNGVGSIAGPARTIRATRREVKRRLKPYVDRIAFVDERKLRWAERLSGIFKLFTGLDLGKLVDVIRPTLGLLAGRPTEISLKLAYAGIDREPPTKDGDPARDGCGLLWLSPVVPMRGGDVREFLDLIRPIFARWSVKCAVTFTTVNARALDCTLPILFDPAEPGAHRRACDARDEILRSCVAAGFVPYRLGVDTMDLLADRDDALASMLRDIKRAVDPGGVIAPGRYVPSSESGGRRAASLSEDAPSADR